MPCVSYYKDIASLLLRLALTAPTQQGPVRSSSQLLGLLDPEVLARLFEGDPERAREAASLRGSQQARAVVGAVSRFANFFHAVGTGFDAAECGWSFEDVDFAYLRAPDLAGREDADAACRLLLEDFAHYATLRKPRRGEDVTLVFDEFSAIGGGRETAIQLVERVRDAGCAVILSAHPRAHLHHQARAGDGAVSPFYSPATGTTPCAALWYDARALGRPRYRLGTPTGHHDGWKPCGAAGTELVEIEGASRLVCPDHARQTRAIATAGLASQLRWRH